MAKNPYIEINTTFNDCDDLKSGKVFDWTYQTNTGQLIDVRLYSLDSDLSKEEFKSVYGRYPKDEN
jgi:hypothetical protein|tara:strand:+ start:16 stop:213 length:198 start_codon:yes stop_codon:yes gene_type:complete